MKPDHSKEPLWDRVWNLAGLETLWVGSDTLPHDSTYDLIVLDAQALQSEKPLSEFAKYLKPDGVILAHWRNPLSLRSLADLETPHFENEPSQGLNYRNHKSYWESLGWPVHRSFLLYATAVETTTILDTEFVDRALEVAIGLAMAASEAQNIRPGMKAFPLALSWISLSEAGIFAEVAPAYLTVLCQNPSSPTLNQVLWNCHSQTEMAWHLSPNRKSASLTVFKSDDKGLWAVKGSQKEPIKNGLPLRWKLIREMYFGPWSNFENSFIRFLKSTLEKFVTPEGIDPRALDAVYLNAILNPKRELEFFDLEWVAKNPIEPSYLVFRNVFALMRDFDTLTTHCPYRNLKSFYLKLCSELKVPPNYETHLGEEAVFQSLTSKSDPIARHLHDLRDFFEQPLAAPYYMRSAEQLSRRWGNRSLQDIKSSVISKLRNLAYRLYRSFNKISRQDSVMPIPRRSDMIFES